MAKPLFSIITITYNAEDTIAATLETVDTQSFSDYEHLIIDGASKDTTLALLKNSPSPRRRIFSSPDRGIYDAMNKGRAKASGQYLIFLNAGDRFHSPETLKEIAETIFDNDRPDIVYGQTQLVDIQGNRIADRHLTAPGKLTFRSFAQGMLVCHQAFVVKAEIAPDYNLAYRYSADYDWCIRCLLKSQANHLVDDILIDYLQEGTTTANLKASLLERFRIMCHYYGTIPTVLRHLKFLPRFIKRRSKKLKQ